jgi:sensor c-di-GMP phosphodiesterase-like protein
MLKLALRVKVMALTLVAEGPETNSQAGKLLKDLGVSMAQAWCFSKSLSAKSFL